MVTTPITLADLTTATFEGSGVFDQLMKAGAAQLDSQFNKTRIQGSDYATVYLGLIQASMSAALNFLATRDKISVEVDQIVAQTALVNAQADNARQQLILLTEQTATEVLNQAMIKAQTCKLKAEYDLTMRTIDKTGKETDLLAQKITTEKAQVLELGVDDNSVVGRQKALYKAQTDGFKSDKIQKGTKILVDSWQARRMTDDGVVADDTNKLADSFVGQTITVLLADMNA